MAHREDKNENFSCLVAIVSLTILSPGARGVVVAGE